MKNKHVQQWVDEMVQLCEPDQVYWCDGSELEKKQITEEALQSGELIELDQEKMPGCYLHRSAIDDVARVESRTFICSTDEGDAGATNHWMDPQEAYAKARPLFQGSMKGRTLYVIPFCMGPLGSEFSQMGVQVTDSRYVVLNMRMMTRMGGVVWSHLGDSDSFTKGLHSTAQLDPEGRYIMHFPQDNTIWSVNSGYGGNALLGKKCMALRIGSYLGQQQGWMAEHMLILGVQYPEGHTEYIVAAFPSACGKTNLAMLTPPEGLEHKGYKIWTVGDDIAWLRIGKDGDLRAVNPEHGFFGVLPGTNSKTNPNALAAMKKDSLYTNVLLKDDQTVWWEDADGDVPEHGIDWKGDDWTPDSVSPGAHPNSRFTAPLEQCPTVSDEINKPEGVPITAIFFGGRRSQLNPLVYETYSWAHGVYAGATMCSESTAAQEGGAQKIIKHDPMAMRPFCGYNMGDYFQHWLDMGEKLEQKPRVFYVNWFRQDEDGRYLWPGFGDNLRVIEWALARCRSDIKGRETAIGYVPYVSDLDCKGLGLSESDMNELLKVDDELWEQELFRQTQFLRSLGPRVPDELWMEHKSLMKRLK